MIEVCTRCETPTGVVFCPSGHVAKLEDYRKENGAFVEPLYSCTDRECTHSITAHAGSGKTHLIVKHALFNKHIGGKKPGTHRFGCPPTLALRQIAPPRNRRRADRLPSGWDVREVKRLLPKIAEALARSGATERLAELESVIALAKVVGGLDGDYLSVEFVLALCDVLFHMEPSRVN